ncbi:MAG: CinA family protein [Campylobacterales bacterium]
MKTALYIIGNSIIHNNALKEYIFRQILEKKCQVDAVFLLRDNEKNFVFDIESMDLSYTNIIIICDKKLFHTLSKMVATISEDALITKDELLIPSSYYSVCKSGFSLESKDRMVTMQFIEEEFEELLVEPLYEFKEFYLLRIDTESTKLLLSPIADSFGLKLEIEKQSEGITKCTIFSNSFGYVDEFLNSVQNLFGNKLIKDSSLFVFAINKLLEKSWKITFAESCTGGSLAYEFVKVPGCLGVLDGSVVSYSDAIKNGWLKVENDTLRLFGAVSSECVEQMLEGALRLSGADVAVAISGIAGPEGGSKEKPVGTVFVGAASRDGRKSINRLNLKGDREYIQKKALYGGMSVLFEVLLD